jgi:hypothetical protein
MTKGDIYDLSAPINDYRNRMTGRIGDLGNTLSQVDSQQLTCWNSLLQDTV